MTSFDLTSEHLEREERQKKLLKFAGEPMTCCVSLIDIVCSTKTASKIPESKLGMFYSIFLNYVSDIIKLHEGTVVKNIGDSLLYYFAESKKGDPIIDSFHCNLDIIEKRDELNEIMETERLPRVSYRISSDYGKVFVATSTISSANDIFGPTVNMCAKINRVGDANGFCIGNDLYINARARDEFMFEEIRDNHLRILKNRYPVYNVKKTD